MRIALIGCMVLNREIAYLTAQSGTVCRAWWLKQGLHDTPELLRERLQETIDRIEKENDTFSKSRRFDAICLAYGLCSNGVLGLRSRTLPLVIPRCDDCISLFLGSADRYRALFGRLNGIYWFNPGWIEQAFVPTKENYEERLLEYTEAYGEENAEFLMESENSWVGNYKNCVYIGCPFADKPEYEALAQKSARDFGWAFQRVEGDLSYLDALVNGPWDEERFLTCPPGCRVEADYSDKKIRCVPAACGAQTVERME